METGLLFHKRIIRQRFSNKETFEKRTKRSGYLEEGAKTLLITFSLFEII